MSARVRVPVGSSPPVRYMRYIFPTDIPSAAVLCGPVLILSHTHRADSVDYAVTGLTLSR